VTALTWDSVETFKVKLMSSVLLRVLIPATRWEELEYCSVTCTTIDREVYISMVTQISPVYGNTGEINEALSSLSPHELSTDTPACREVVLNYVVIIDYTLSKLYSYNRLYAV